MNPFRRPTAETLRRRALEEAERDLHNATLWLEHWIAEVGKYKARTTRLRGELEPAKVTPALVSRGGVGS